MAKQKKQTRKKVKTKAPQARHKAGHKIRAARHTSGPGKIRRKTRIHTEPSDPTRQRLQKVLAAAGIDSRRNCEELILQGVVQVNGSTVDELPVFVNPETDIIKVNGKPIPKPEKVYYLLNKTKNTICTNMDPYGRRKAIDLIDSDYRIFCVGRLDADTTGAIILTNDSELANRLTHPRYELPKTYEVTIKGRVEGEDIEKLKKGTWLAEGKTGRAAVKVIKRNNQFTILQIIIQQGLNRQIRRMLARLEYKVKALKRTQIGNITIKGLPLGAYRELTKSQVKYLKNITGMKE